VNASELLRGCMKRGVGFVLQGDRLRIRDPGGILTQKEIESLRTQKSAIIAVARRLPSCSECGPIVGPDEPECWWGLSRVHLECGKAAWEREWRVVAKETAPGSEAA
jgi:TubC N-terminal docking domain